MRSAREYRFAFAATLVAACSGQPLDLGSPAPTPTTPPPIEITTPVGVWPTPAQCAAEPQLPIVGTWKGYMVGAKFKSGSDAVELRITGANSSVVCGSITFGTGPGPKPPPDLDRGYTPGIIIAAQNIDERLATYEGMAMTILEGRPDLPRLRFRATKNELWKPWCEHQTPYLQETKTDAWYCVPFNADRVVLLPPEGCALPVPDGGSVLTDCAKIALCSTVCACKSAGCTADDTTHTEPFDFRVDGDTMQGPGDTGEIYLTKQP